MLVADLAQLRERAEQEQGKARTMAAELARMTEKADRQMADRDALVVGVERDVSTFKGMLDEMKRTAEQPVAPAWVRWIASARSGRQA